MKSFQELFAGRSDAFGQYPRPPKVLGGEKTTHKDRRTVKPEHGIPLSEEHWQSHLNGEMGLGIVPVRVDDTINWFCFDIDKYAVGTGLHKKLLNKIKKHGLPLVMTLSKSNGAHLWCFLKEPIEAKEARRLMAKWTPLLGFTTKDPKCERFPIQNQVDQFGVGSWVNLPYFGGNLPLDQVQRVAIGPTLEPLTLEEFVGLANRTMIDPCDLEHIGEEVETVAIDNDGSRSEVSVDREHAEAPPCVQSMMADGVHEGSRQHSLYNFGIYYRRMDPDGWQNRMQRANLDYVDPPIPIAELSSTLRSFSNKAADAYQYKCEPMKACGICDQAACLTRKFGIGKGPSVDPGMIEDLRRVMDDTPYYMVTVRDSDDSQVSFPMGVELQSQKAFSGLMLLYAQRVIQFPKGFKWMDYITPLIQNAKKVDPPQALTNSGRVKDLFREWTGRHCPSTRDPERVDTGSPYFDSATSTILFKGRAFESWLQRNGIRLKDRELWPILVDQLQVERDTLTLGNGQEIECFRAPCSDPWFIVDDEGEL